ncbi:MAG: hypothetical protein ACR2MQ_01775 [Gemmatimonadaceae bacterium]
MTRRERLSLLSTLLSVALAIFGAYEALDHVRVVDVLILFFAGMGSGAGLTALAVQLRGQRSP